MAATDLLKHAREARRLKLADIAARTRIDCRILERVERGEFESLPAGIYARAYLRGYAAAVGLDPDQTLRLFEPMLPPADGSLRAILSTRAAARGGASRSGRSIGWRRAAAAILDALLLVGVNSGFLSLAAAACGVSARTLVTLAAPGIALVFLSVIACYFLLLGGVAGWTCGSRLFGVRLVRPASGPIDLRTAARRGLQCLLAQGSIFVESVTSDPDRPLATS